jgi:hypothetical protein
VNNPVGYIVVNEAFEYYDEYYSAQTCVEVHTRFYKTKEEAQERAHELNLDHLEEVAGAVHSWTYDDSLSGYIGVLSFEDTRRLCTLLGRGEESKEEEQLEALKDLVDSVDSFDTSRLTDDDKAFLLEAMPFVCIAKVEALYGE